jgi:hypothetical protein
MRRGGGSITSDRQSEVYIHIYIHPAIKSNVAFPTCVALVIPIFLVQNPSVCECACTCVFVCVSVRGAHTINNATNMKNPAPKTLLPAGITSRNRYFCTSKASTFVLVKQTFSWANGPVWLECTGADFPLRSRKKNTSWRSRWRPNICPSQHARGATSTLQLYIYIYIYIYISKLSIWAYTQRRNRRSWGKYIYIYIYIYIYYIYYIYIIYIYII